MGDLFSRLLLIMEYFKDDKDTSRQEIIMWFLDELNAATNLKQMGNLLLQLNKKLVEHRHTQLTIDLRFSEAGNTSCVTLSQWKAGEREKVYYALPVMQNPFTSKTVSVLHQLKIVSKEWVIEHLKNDRME